MKKISIMFFVLATITAVSVFPAISLAALSSNGLNGLRPNAVRIIMRGVPNNGLQLQKLKLGGVSGLRPYGNTNGLNAVNNGLSTPITSSLKKLAASPLAKTNN